MWYYRVNLITVVICLINAILMYYYFYFRILLQLYTDKNAVNETDYCTLFLIVIKITHTVYENKKLL